MQYPTADVIYFDAELVKASSLLCIPCNANWPSCADFPWPRPTQQPSPHRLCPSLPLPCFPAQDLWYGGPGVNVQLGSPQLDHTADEVCSLGRTFDRAGLSSPKAVAFCPFCMPQVNQSFCLLLYQLISPGKTEETLTLPNRGQCTDHPPSPPTHPPPLVKLRLWN